MASPVARWLTKSYLRWSVAWTLFFGLSVSGVLLVGGAPHDVSIGLGVFAAVGLGLTWVYMRRWGRFRNEDPWDDPPDSADPN